MAAKQRAPERPPATATFRFHADLNDFLPAARRGLATVHALPVPTTVKDAIEAQGVPHVELGAVLVDDLPSSLERPLHGDERVEVFARFSPSAHEVPTLPRLPEPRRFVLDVHLGTLARRLRLLGFDTWYRSHADDEELAVMSAAERRILLTRDIGLLKRSMVVHGAWVRATDPSAQILEVVDRFELGPRLAPYSRCIRCNGSLRPAADTEVEQKVPPRARAAHDTFHLCGTCGQAYWHGTHTTALDDVVDQIRRHVSRREELQAVD